MGPELNAGHSFVQLVVSRTVLEELLITATCWYPYSFLLSKRKSQAWYLRSLTLLPALSTVYSILPMNISVWVLGILPEMMAFSGL